MSAIRRALAVIAMLTALTGCAAPRGPIDDPAMTAKLGFIQAGASTRAEVEARLGPPKQTYEGGRVATYVVAERDGRLTTGPSPGQVYTLVIEYAADGIIARRSLVARSR